MTIEQWELLSISSIIFTLTFDLGDHAKTFDSNRLAEALGEDSLALALYLLAVALGGNRTRAALADLNRSPSPPARGQLMEVAARSKTAIPASGHYDISRPITRRSGSRIEAPMIVSGSKM